MKAGRGMVFGVFDGLHEGHKSFLREAAAACEKLVVVVAQEGAARALKGRAPKESLESRIAAVSALDRALTVVRGDVEQGSWNVLKTQKPDVVILGYDQKELAKELEAHAIPYIYAKAHEPAKFKSSLINGTVKPEDKREG